MDIKNLKQTISKHTPIGMNASLPFAIKSEEGLKIRWFVYDLIFGDNYTIIKVKEVCTMDVQGNVAVKLNLRLSFEINNMREGKEFDEEMFYKEFDRLYNLGDIDALDRLLVNAESDASLMIYETVSMLEDI